MSPGWLVRPNLSTSEPAGPLIAWPSGQSATAGAEGSEDQWHVDADRRQRISRSISRGCGSLGASRSADVHAHPTIKPPPRRAGPAGTTPTGLAHVSDDGVILPRCTSAPHRGQWCASRNDHPPSTGAGAGSAARRTARRARRTLPVRCPGATLEPVSAASTPGTATGCVTRLGSAWTTGLAPDRTQRVSPWRASGWLLGRP